jgi:hypothetical protein
VGVAATALEAPVAGPGVVGPGLAAGVVGPSSGLVGPVSAVEYSAPYVSRDGGPDCSGRVPLADVR